MTSHRYLIEKFNTRFECSLKYEPIYEVNYFLTDSSNIS